MISYHTSNWLSEGFPKYVSGSKPTCTWLQSDENEDDGDDDNENDDVALITQLKAAYSASATST